MRELELDALPEELQAPLKSMRTLRPGEGLRERLCHPLRASGPEGVVRA